MKLRVFFFCAVSCFAAFPLVAQDNYEIQVYGSETMAPGHTMLELHRTTRFPAAKK